MNQSQVQIGKNGLTSGIIENLKNAFKTHQIVKISVLKSGGRDRKKIKEMADKIPAQLGKNYTYRIIGFTIIVQKWRKARS